MCHLQPHIWLHAYFIARFIPVAMGLRRAGQHGTGRIDRRAAKAAPPKAVIIPLAVGVALYALHRPEVATIRDAMRLRGISLLRPGACATRC
jgi:hypothetical protein